MIVATGSLIGRYCVQEVAGRGTSSIVYRALDPEGGVVAIKAIREELLVATEIDSTLRRFDREVVIGQDLRHQGIVRLLESGQHNGLPYLVMEYVIGDTFDALIRARAPLPPDAARDIVVKVLGALAHAHAKKVIHRDVKPANIVLRDPDGEPVLMDFGIARLDGSDLTQHGELLGTPTYLAPEQLRGEAIDHRADLFAAGVMLFFAVTGRRPFDGTIAEILRGICFDDPPALSSFAPCLGPLDPIIARALAKDPDERYPTAGAFAADLAGLRFTADPGPHDPADDATLVTRAAGPVTLDELEAIFTHAAADGVNETIVSHVEHLLGQVADQDRWRLASLCGGPALAGIADLVIATAPLPGQRLDRRGHWLSAIDLFRLLLDHAVNGPEGVAAGGIAADTAYFLAAGILAHGSEVAARLATDEGPDIGREALSLLRVDSISFGLARLGASHERRLVDATARVIAGQVVVRAAAAMGFYATSRDPMARFDVVGMLVNVEDLVALAQRLLEDAENAAFRPDPVATRSIAALSALLEAMTGLVEASGADLDQALSHDDDTELALFLGHLKQMLLIHQFCTRLDRDLFQPGLAVLSQRVHALATRLTGVVTAAPIISAAGQERATALYDIAFLAGWKELATRLLRQLRAGVLVEHP